MRKPRTIYILNEVYEAFITYASVQAPLKSCEIWEKALAEYMISHPVDMINLTIQQKIALEIPSKQDQLRMRLITDEIKFIFERFEKVGQSNVPILEERLGVLVRKGVNIKKPTAEFVGLLEEAMKHI